jgi:hypothetical protein
MNEELPTLVIVGRVNRGKSSILSTLAEDDSIIVSPEPGTTQDVQRFPLRVDGEPLFQMVDTPGFEDAPRALRFLLERESTAANRRGVVKSFVEHFKHQRSEFEQECKLLQPILDGGAILYVVDGSHPYRRNYEAEMEILRWTGQPRIALINQIGSNDHTDEWRAALGQFFSIVRTFNAHRAGFAERIKLFEGLREVDEQWRAPFDRAINALRSDWNRRLREASRIIAEMVVTALLHTERITVPRGDSVALHRRRIEERFHVQLRKHEERGRRKIETIFCHRRLTTREEPIGRHILDEDLFSDRTWETLGLSLPKLIGAGFVTGASAGGILDLMTGGALLGAGIVTGGIAGGGGALYYGMSRFEKASDVLHDLQGGKTLRIGPHQSPNFPWILLDRALLHCVAVRDRAHAKRDPLELPAPPPVETRGDGWMMTMPDDQRRALAKLLSRFRGRRVLERREALETALADEVEKLLRQDSTKP